MACVVAASVRPASVAAFGWRTYTAGTAVRTPSAAAARARRLRTRGIAPTARRISEQHQQRDADRRHGSRARPRRTVARCGLGSLRGTHASSSLSKSFGGLCWSTL